jgi:hypothetical protein
MRQVPPLRRFTRLAGVLRAAAGLATAFAVCLMAAATAPAPAADPKADDRLQTKVTLAMGNATLDSVLQAIGGATNVPMNAGKGPEDWQVKEMPVNVFVKDVPAWLVMEQLAKLTDFYWQSVGEGDQKGYRLWQDLKARQAQQAERDTRMREELKMRTEMGVKNIQSFAALAKITPKDLEQLQKDDPAALFFVTTPGFKAMPHLIAALTPQQQILATTKEGARIRYKEMPEPLQASLREYVNGMLDLVQKLAPAANTITLPEPDWNRGVLVVQAPTYEQISTMGSVVPLTSELKVEGLGPLVDAITMPIFDTKSPIGRMIGKALTQLTEGAPVQSLQIAMAEEFAKSVAQGMGVEPPATPDDPELLKTVKFQGKSWASLDNLVEAFHNASGLNIITDNLPNPGMQGPSLAAVFASEAPIYRVLHSFKALFGLEYVKEDGIIRMRDRDWARKRDWLVPREMLNRWRSKARSQDGLTLAELVEMSKLTEDQCTYGLMSVPDLLVCAMVLNPQTRAVAQFLGSLTAEQSKKLASGEKLTVEALTPDQLASIQKAWNEAHKSGDEEERTLPTGTTIAVRPAMGATSTPITAWAGAVVEVAKPNAQEMRDAASVLRGSPDRSIFSLYVPKVPLPGLEEEKPQEKKPEPGDTKRPAAAR